MNIHDKIQGMTEREALKYLLAVILGEYPNDDDRFTEAWAIAVRFGIDPKELA